MRKIEKNCSKKGRIQEEIEPFCSKSQHHRRHCRPPSASTPRSLVGPKRSSTAVVASSVNGEISDARKAADRLPSLLLPPPPKLVQSGREEHGPSVLKQAAIQNDVVSFLPETKRRRFVSSRDKTTSFRFFILFLNKVQNDIVLNKTAPKRCRFEAAVNYSKRRRFRFLKAAPKRLRFKAILNKTTSFWYRRNFKKKYC